MVARPAANCFPSMIPASPDPEFRRRIVRLWLLAVAALVLVTVLVGGVTRLTESGLSIVEWKPITGTVPPLTEAEWQAEFDKYRATPQYRQINPGMRVEDFKTIFWWEWTHRLLGRAVGAAFLLPFLVFLWRGWVERPLQIRLWGIFGLGVIQGAVGWWMVTSGLGGVTVSPYRLAFHLTLACVIFAALVWTIQDMWDRAPPPLSAGSFRTSAFGLLVIVLIQFYFGALLAGLDGGLAYNTWPLIDGTLVPSWERLTFFIPIWRNLFENILTVQFFHRILAYVLFLAAVLHFFGLYNNQNRSAARTAAGLAAAVTAQAIVGVATLLNQAPLGLALLHQATALVVLTAAAVHAHRMAVSAVPSRSA